jgi:hypothetical protein
MTAHFRSIAIDHLKDQFYNENKPVIYVYFDYKTQDTQTRYHIVATILMQLLSFSDNIPPEIELLYNEFVRKKKKLEISKLTQLLTSYSQNVSSIYAVFDALDECNNDHLSEILGLLAHLQQLGYRLLVSSRLHLQQLLQDNLTNTHNFEISANELDLKNYIITRLNQRGNKNNELTEKCLGLTKDVQGMYISKGGLFSDR